MIKQTYIDKITFKWDEISKCAYEAFFAKDDETKLILNHTSLATGGLMLNDIRLDKLIEKAQNLDNNDKLTIEQKFITNCLIKSSTAIIDDKNHMVDNTLFTKYNNSSLLDEQSAIITNLPANNFPISERCFDEKSSNINYYLFQWTFL